MRIRFFLAVALTFPLACKSQPAPTARSAVAPAAPTAPTAPDKLTGKVVETIDAAQYTYLKLQTASGEKWAAVPTVKAAVGTEVTIQGPMWMENFNSKTLNRTWPLIAFGTLAGDETVAVAKLPPGHPPMGPQASGAAGAAAGPGMWAAQAAGDTSPSISGISDSLSKIAGLPSKA